MVDYNDLPIFLIPTATSRAVASGQYVFTGTSACTITLPNINPSVNRQRDTRLMYFKNRGTAILTITPASGNIFDVIAVASIVLAPGEAVVIIPDNVNYNVVARSGVPRIATASLPAWAAAYVGLVVFDTTANKLKVAGVAAWETVTSV